MYANKKRKTHTQKQTKTKKFRRVGPSAGGGGGGGGCCGGWRSQRKWRSAVATLRCVHMSKRMLAMPDTSGITTCSCCLAGVVAVPELGAEPLHAMTSRTRSENCMPSASLAHAAAFTGSCARCSACCRTDGAIPAAPANVF